MPLWGTDAPKPFDAPKNLTLTGATPAEPPLIEGRLIQMTTGPATVAKAIPSLKEETNIRYDYKAKSFVTPRSPASEPNNVAGRSSTDSVVVARVGSHGNSGSVITRPDGSHGNSESSTGGGASHSSSSASSGGGSGGGHSGGGSSASSSSGSSSSSGAASSAGSHH